MAVGGDIDHRPAEERVADGCQRFWKRAGYEKISVIRQDRPGIVGFSRSLTSWGDSENQPEATTRRQGPAARLFDASFRALVSDAHDPRSVVRCFGSRVRRFRLRDRCSRGFYDPTSRLCRQMLFKPANHVFVDLLSTQLIERFVEHLGINEQGLVVAANPVKKLA